MKIIDTGFKGLTLIEPKVVEDTRGWFFESYNQKSFQEAGLRIDFVQDNHSSSKKNVIRGLHFQVGKYAQTKLIRVLAGEILDVTVDLRKDQPTFGKIFRVRLSADNKRQLLIPKGFAHGFSVLSDNAEVAYKTDGFYHPDSERGVLFSDPQLAIDWEVDRAKAIISSKDLSLPLFRDTASFE